MLKEEAHQGKGVHVLPSDATLGATLQRDTKGRPKFALAQQLVADQLLVGGRPFYIRCSGRAVRPVYDRRDLGCCQVSWVLGHRPSWPHPTPIHPTALPLAPQGLGAGIRLRPRAGVSF